MTSWPGLMGELISEPAMSALVVSSKTLTSKLRPMPTAPALKVVAMPKTFSCVEAMTASPFMYSMPSVPPVSLAH